MKSYWRFSTARGMRVFCLSVCLAGVLLTAGCGSLSPEQRIDKARQAYQQRDYRAAEVQLKTVLRKHQDNAKAWALLGRTSLAKRQYDDAIYQLRKAQSAGRSLAELALPLGRALLAEGQAKQALEVLKPDSTAGDKVKAAIVSLRGDAYAGLGDRKKAAQAYKSALAKDPNQLDALRGEARLAISRGDLKSAKQTLTKATSAKADDVGSLNLLGQVDYRMHDCDSSIQHLGHALSADQGVLGNSQVQTARVLMADCQLRLGDTKAAQKNVKMVLSANQSNAFGNYLQALLSIRRGEYQQAANHVQAVLNVNPQNRRSMMLMAWIRIAQGRADDAQPFLTRVLQQAPDNIAALRLQAGLWMAQDQKQQAQELIEKAYKRDSQQPSLRGALKQVMAELDRQTGEASGLDDVTLQLGLARSLAQMGSQSAAQTILGKIQAKTPPQKRALAETKIQIAIASDNTSEAIKRAKMLAGQNANDLGAKRLLADSYIAAGQYDAADQVLAQAQQANTSNISIVQARTRLATRLGHYSNAIKLLEPLHEKNPERVDITLGLAGLYGRAGDDKRRIDLLSSAAKKQPDAPRLSKALARAYLGSDKTDKAMALIDEQLAKHDNDPDWLQLKGVAQLTSGETDGGIKTLEKAADQAPDQPGRALSVAKALLSSGRIDQAIQRLQKLRKQSPDYWPAAGFLALAQAAAGHTTAALKQVDALRESNHKHEADILDGDVLRNAKRYKQADKAYTRAFDDEPSARLALIMFNTRRAGQMADPARPLRQWLEQKPNDGAVALTLANWYQAQGNNDKAAKVYQNILSKHGDVIIALNNLALIQAKTHPKQALAYARRAHAKAPKSPAVTDTLGWLLVENNQPDKGIPLLKQAENKAGSASAEIRFHLGAALARRGRSADAAQAKKLLNQALSAGLPNDEAQHARSMVGGLDASKSNAVKGES